MHMYVVITPHAPLPSYLYVNEHKKAAGMGDLILQPRPHISLYPCIYWDRKGYNVLGTGALPTPLIIRKAGEQTEISKRQ